MPFQDRVSSTAWPEYCLAYNDLKRSVYEILRSDTTSVFPEKEFQDLLQIELDKINLFAVIKYEDIFRSLQSVANATNPPSSLAIDPIAVKQYHIELEQTIDRVGTEIVHLDEFVRTNCEGFIKLITKFDKILRSNGANWFIARLGKEEFCNVNFQSLFILLSLTWSKFRASQAGGGERADSTWRPPETFVRSTAKYWVKPENVARLKADVLKHLPYLIFGSSIKDQERFLDPTTVFDVTGVESETMSETQLITSIYFDNTNRDIYKQRIMRKEGARLVRFRWYGTNEGSRDQDIFIERKVHHESWFDEASSKDRFVVKQKDVFSLMKGQYDLGTHFDKLMSDAKSKGKDTKTIVSMKELGEEVDAFIRSLGLQPFIRTCYYRCAFQLSTSNDVRISLDTQMSLINEFRSPMSPPWCRLASDVLAESDVVRFPYAILEVKLADARNTPSWVNSMLVSCGAVRVHKFSKFLHAMAFLHPENTNILPHWFRDFQKKSSKKQLSPLTPVSIGGESIPTREKRIERILISQSSEASAEPQQVQDEEEEEGLLFHKPSLIPVKDMMTIEPKSIYANERTFLHYCQKGVFLLTVGIGLSYGVSPTPWISNLIRVIVGIVCIGYLLIVYASFLRRQNQLLTRKAVTKNNQRLDVKRGPLLAASMIMMGALLSFANTTGLMSS
jgi:SPX domain protein involved in polyphosphate accumulation